MLRQLVDAVSEEVRRGGYRPIPPCTPAELDVVRRRAVEILGQPLPEPYIEFLSMMDGFYVSSMQLFGSRRHPIEFAGGTKGNADVWVDDVIDTNLELRIDRNDHENLISLVYDQMLRGWDPVNENWYLREHSGGQHRTYRSFEELLADGLQDVGVDVRHLMPADFEFFSVDDRGNRIYGTRAP